MLSRYELQRELNIRKNEELLGELGVNKASVSIRKDTDDKGNISQRASASISVGGVTGPHCRDGAEPLLRLSCFFVVIQRKRRHPIATTDSNEPLERRKSSRLAAQQGFDAGIRRNEASSVAVGPPQTLLKPQAAIRISSRQVDLSTHETGYVAPLPTRDTNGTIRFEEPYTDFQPNLTPSEVLGLGSFGGTFFRQFYSQILRTQVPSDYDEFPEEWFHPVGPLAETTTKPDNITRTIYSPDLNRYGVKAGQSVEEWERSGWIKSQDPRGWFQWYCRFYQGRRTIDDDRQIARCEHSRSRLVSSL
jgi:hypothetical protein